MSEPLVSVITPVYNTEKYLAEAIESVLAQTYRNWDYVIVDNASTDRSREIAESYAARDARIKVVHCDEHVEFIGNLNRGMRQVSPESRYCKVVHADDWLFPQCIERMVRVAEANPSVGIVASYILAGKKVLSDKLEYPAQVVPGRELCRATLMGALFVFGCPTSLLIRSDLIHKRIDTLGFFYDDRHFHTDTDVCLDLLGEVDFGFVHQVLSFMRIHQGSQTSQWAKVSPYHLGHLIFALKYGRKYLSETEYRSCVGWRLQSYQAFLLKHYLRLKKHGTLDYHRKALRDHGYSPGVIACLAGTLLRMWNRATGGYPQYDGSL